MNSIDSFFYASKFKGNEDKIEHSPRDEFNTIQNFTRRHEKWL